MAQSEKRVGSAVEKLSFISSPLHHDQSRESTLSPNETSTNVVETGYLPHEQEVRIAHNTDATNLEVFYDLFLACLALFSQNQQLHSLSGLSSYAGYFCIMWTTWFLTSIYDVRFLKDSIFARCARGVHLGVLVGFVVVSPNFKTQDQDPVVFRVFSIILMASRLSLAIEYGSVLYHVRKFKNAQLSLAIMVAVNFVAAIVYLGIAFGFRQGHNSRVFSLWYVTAGVEIIISVTLSHYYRILSFHGTHIMKRVGLLTCIFFGESVASACNSITKVVKVEDHVDVWTSQTIGTVTACTAIVYIVFMVYMDWVVKTQLPGWRQMTWTLLHFPLHLAMSLFMEGCAQFIVFWKLSEKTALMISGMTTLFTDPNPDNIASEVREWVGNITAKYPPVYSMTYTTLDNALDAIDNMNFTESFGQPLEVSPGEFDPSPQFMSFLEELVRIVLTLDNIFYNIYGVDFTKDALEDDPVEDEDPDFGEVQWAINERSLARFRVVFQYTFVCAGCFLMVANLISITSRTKKWTKLAIMYHTFIFTLAVAISLLAAISQNENHLMNYQMTPWVLPTLLLAYLLVLTINHVSGWVAARRDRMSESAGGVEEQYRLGDPSPSDNSYAAVSNDKPASHAPANNRFSVPRRPVPDASSVYQS